MKAYVIQSLKEYEYLDTIVRYEGNGLLTTQLINSVIVTDIVTSFVKVNVDIPFTLYTDSIKNVFDFMIKGKWFILSDKLSDEVKSYKSEFTPFTRKQNPVEDLIDCLNLKDFKHNEFPNFNNLNEDILEKSGFSTKPRQSYQKKV